MTVLKWSLGLLVAASAIVAVTVRLWGAVAFNPGDVFAAVGNGQVKHFTPTGTLLETLDTTTGSSETTGMCFDATGNLFVTNFTTGSVSKFNNTGDLVSANFISGITTSPESCVIDTAGNIYVGVADGDADIRKYNAAGTLLTQFDVATERRGSDWIDLAADQCTMFYTSEGFTIKRYDVCTNTQLSDFATGLTGLIFAFRILPDGGVLVAETSQVQRLDSSGAVVSTYTASGGPFLFALNRDPNGTQFWTGDVFSGDVFRFNISPSGPPVSQFNAGILTALEGLAIFGELLVSQPTPTPTVLAATATATPTVPTPTPTSVPPTSTPTPTVTPTPPPPAGGAICRSPGFWGTHADADSQKACSQNITAAALDLAAGDDIEICGEIITGAATTDNDATPTVESVNNASSAIEALCVSPAGDIKLQLVRQLTALALNCLISGLGETCGTGDLGDLFANCNNVCDTTGPTGGETIQSCIDKIDCINNGGNFNTTTNQCELGTCFVDTIDMGIACNFDALPCASGECVPFANSCRTQELPTSVLGGNDASCPDPGPAGSSDECKAARKTACTVIPPGESSCNVLFGGIE